MAIDNEADRLIQVYRNYRESEATYERWSDASAGNRAMIEERDRVLGHILGENGLFVFRTLDDVDVAGKRVLVRADLNVPMEDARTLMLLALNGPSRIFVSRPSLRNVAAAGAWMRQAAQHRGSKPSR
jgi:Phosphoglycerate kinase